MLEAGVTFTEVPVNEPGIQLYVVAPDAVNVADVPEQTVAVEVVTVTVGVGLTVIVRVAVPVHPLAAVPVTVYVVVVAGVTVTGEPLSDPGIQL